MVQVIIVTSSFPTLVRGKLCACVSFYYISFYEVTNVGQTETEDRGQF